MIQIKNLDYFDHGKQILKNINLEVNDGESVALLGTNGAGKSTLIDILTNMLHPSKGTVTINAEPFRKVKGSVGVLYEYTPYFYYMTVNEWLTYLCIIYDTSKREIAPLIHVLDMDKYLNKQFQLLSKGEKRKVSVLTTLMHNPNVLILDEPNSGLDPFITSAVWKLFKQHKRTILFTSHDWKDAETYADRIAFISNGEILASDTYQNFLSERYLPSPIKLILNKEALAKDMYKGIPHIFDQENVFLYSENISELTNYIVDKKIEYTKIKTNLNDVYLILKYKFQHK